MRNVSRISMPRLQKLKIKFPRLKISSNNFEEMSRNVPSLKELNISNQSIGVLGTLLESFKNLETFVIGCDSDSPEVVDYSIDGLRAENLKELCIHSSFTNQKALKCSKTILEIVCQSLVNLEKLKLRNVIALNQQQMKDILRSCSKLTHITIENVASDYKIDDSFVEILLVSGPRLKYFQSRGAEVAVNENSISSKFARQFTHIEVKPWNKLFTLRTCKWQHADD